MPGVPGLFLPEQAAGWKKVVDAVHARGGHIYAQLWHSGRANLPQLTGTPTLAPSAAAWDDPDEVFAYPPPHTTERLRLRDHPPVAMTTDKIHQTIADYCAAARLAVDACGFDGVELHAGNGYLPEQFLSSNVNRRDDAYGGDPARRCRFVLELMGALAASVGGADRLAIRLTPFGLFNQARGEQRLETWGHLCRRLRADLPALSYVSFVEPRYEQIFSAAEKQRFLDSWGLPEVDLSVFRDIFSGRAGEGAGAGAGDALPPTPFFSAGGWDDGNSWEVVAEEGGQADALLYGRYFISNPDLVERLRRDLPLSPYDRARFYGPFPEDPHVGYTDYPTWDEQQKQK